MFKESTQKHILIVEDESDLRESLKVSLKVSGYAVTTTEKSAEALQKLPELKPDLILLDVLTESMDAGLFMQRLRNLPSELKHTKVIVLTNLDDSETRTKMEKHGIDAYLVKINVSLQDILDSIDTALLPISDTRDTSRTLEL